MLPCVSTDLKNMQTSDLIQRWYLYIVNEPGLQQRNFNPFKVA